MGPQITAFLAEAFSVPNMTIVASVWGTLKLVKRTMSIHDHPVYARMQPLMPLFLCSAAVWIPGAMPVGATIADTVFRGLLLGVISAYGHKVFRQTVLGRDSRVKGE